MEEQQETGTAQEGTAVVSARRVFRGAGSFDMDARLFGSASQFDRSKRPKTTYVPFDAARGFPEGSPRPDGSRGQDITQLPAQGSSPLHVGVPSDLIERTNDVRIRHGRGLSQERRKF